METTSFELHGRNVTGFVIPSGPFNLVGIQTAKGLVGCGAFDVVALEKFNYPAARISGVSTVDDLLKGTIKLANAPAKALGITEGMTGSEAIALL